MTEKEMLDCLQAVWENMTMNKDAEVYRQMLLLLDNMAYFLRCDLGIDYCIEMPDISAGEFDF